MWQKLRLYCAGRWGREGELAGPGSTCWAPDAHGFHPDRIALGPKRREAARNPKRMDGGVSLLGSQS